MIMLTSYDASWTPKPIADDVAFEAIKAGIDSMPPGVKMYINSCKTSDNLPLQPYSRKFQANSFLKPTTPQTSSSFPGSLRSIPNMPTRFSCQFMYE